MMNRQYDYEFVSPDPRESKSEQVGAVIVFPEGVTKAEAEKALESLGLSFFGGRLDDVEVRTFNPDHGSPVWYVP